MSFKFLEYYLKTGKYHHDTPDYKKRGIRKASHNYILKDQILMYVGKGRNQIVCRSEEEKRNAVEWCHHNRKNKDYCNQKDTIRMLNESYYWHGMNKDIESRNYECTMCKAKMIENFVSPNNHSGHAREISINGNNMSQIKEEPMNSVNIFTISGSNSTSLEESCDISTNSFNNYLEEEEEEGWLDVQVSTCVGLSSEIGTATLLERISELEKNNAMLFRENQMLKGKIKTLHRTIENQKNLPMLKDLIKQLKQSLPKTITTTVTNLIK